MPKDTPQKYKEAVIIYVEGGGGQKYVGKIKISISHLPSRPCK